MYQDISLLQSLGTVASTDYEFSLQVGMLALWETGTKLEPAPLPKVALRTDGDSGISLTGFRPSKERYRWKDIWEKCASMEGEWGTSLEGDFTNGPRKDF